MLILNKIANATIQCAIHYLNTSYVDIKHFDTCAYTARYVNLNTSYVDIKHYFTGVGLDYVDYLNTSYVDIKPALICQKQWLWPNLNTSYVDIKLPIKQFKSRLIAI